MPNKPFVLIQCKAEGATSAAVPAQTRSGLRRHYLLSSVAALLAAGHSKAQAGAEKLLLVCGASSPLSGELTKHARKIFLGIPVTTHEGVVTPVMNASAQRTRELFLQRVLYMSAEVYERHQQAKVYRNSGQRIPESGSLPALIAMMNQNPCHLSFMLASDLPGNNSVKVLGPL
jgi:hypothetical protein